MRENGKKRVGANYIKGEIKTATLFIPRRGITLESLPGTFTLIFNSPVNKAYTGRPFGRVPRDMRQV